MMRILNENRDLLGLVAVILLILCALVLNRTLGGGLILLFGAMAWLVAAVDAEKKKREEEREAAQVAPESHPGDTPQAPASNGEEACADASVYVAVLHQDVEVANWVEKRHMRPEYKEKAPQGHDLELEIDEP